MTACSHPCEGSANLLPAISHLVSPWLFLTLHCVSKNDTLFHFSALTVYDLDLT